MIKGMLLQERTCLMAKGWTGPTAPKQSQMRKRELKKEKGVGGERKKKQYIFSLKRYMHNINQFSLQKLALSF